MQIQKYSPADKELWDSFVRTSKNGTFLFCRDFMDYHSDRFTDMSLLFYKDGKLLALLPANEKDGYLYSHQGITYGGLILSDSIKTTQVIHLFEELAEYLKGEGISKLIYKPVPHIYHKFPAEEDLYALFRNNAVLHSRLVSSTINLSKKLKYAELRRRQIKKAQGQNIDVNETDNFDSFWQILNENLADRHGASPVHSLQEIKSLKQKFGNEIRLFCVSHNGNIVGGCLIFETDMVAHIQYISATEEGKRSGALDLLFDVLINDMFPHKKYFDFGTSNEDGGRYLNEGLISQKEGFGARAIVYDTYIISL